MINNSMKLSIETYLKTSRRLLALEQDSCEFYMCVLSGLNKYIRAYNEKINVVGIYTPEYRNTIVTLDEPYIVMDFSLMDLFVELSYIYTIIMIGNVINIFITQYLKNRNSRQEILIKFIFMMHWRIDYLMKKRRSLSNVQGIYLILCCLFILLHFTSFFMITKDIIPREVIITKC